MPQIHLSAGGLGSDRCERSWIQNGAQSAARLACFHKGKAPRVKVVGVDLHIVQSTRLAGFQQIRTTDNR